MPQFEALDIPKMSDKELEGFLNITIAELIPGEKRIQSMLYNRDICIVADLLRRDRDVISNLGQAAYKIIGQALQKAIPA